MSGDCVRFGVRESGVVAESRKRCGKDVGICSSVYANFSIHLHNDAVRNSLPLNFSISALASRQQR
jgi:hypothetical protein